MSNFHCVNVVEKSAMQGVEEEKGRAFARICSLVSAQRQDQRQGSARDATRMGACLACASGLEAAEFKIRPKTRAMFISRPASNVDFDLHETPLSSLSLSSSLPALRAAHLSHRSYPSHPLSVVLDVRHAHPARLTWTLHQPALREVTSTPMATIRAFTIFRDEPEAPVAQTNDGQTETTSITVPPPSGPLLVYAPDKENVDPLTGSRALSEHLLGKKRKTALATKAQPASPTKKARPLAEKPTKKPSSKSRSTDKKAKRSSSSKRSSSTRTRREPSLPRLAEEAEEREVLDQVAIDAKCKDLTVLPLADISEAYEQAPSPEGLVEAAAKDIDDKVRVVDRDVRCRLTFCWLGGCGCCLG